MAELEIVRMEFGSHVYGTNLPGSDRDYKTVFVPDGRDLLLGRHCKVSRNSSTKTDKSLRNTAEDVDVEEFAYAGFLKLLMEGQTVATDMLFVPKVHWVRAGRKWEELHAYRSRLISKRITGFVGYCQSQANKYGIKGSRMNAAKGIVELLSNLDPASRLAEHSTLLYLWVSEHEHSDIAMLATPGGELEHLEVCGRKTPFTITVSNALKTYQLLWDKYGERARAAAANEGIDWKALMHAVRICGQAEELLETGSIIFPRPDRELLLQIRQGHLDYKYVSEIIEDGIQRLEIAQESSPLREEPDVEFIENLIVNTYRGMVWDT